jgi:glycerophosphoryl diester phosphodiesterase
VSGKIVEAVREARSCKASGLTLPDILVLKEPEWLETLHREGLKLHVYPVSPARGEPEFSNWTAESQLEKWRRLKNIGVDAIVSDFAAESVELLGCAGA